MGKLALAMFGTVALCATGSMAKAVEPVTVMTSIDAIPDQFVPQNEEGSGTPKQMNSDTQGESGLPSFTILCETVHPNYFALLETWKSEVDCDKHLAAAHTRKFRNELQPLIGSPYDTIVTTAAMRKTRGEQG